MDQFQKMPSSITYNKELSSNEKITYMLLLDRLQSSKKRKNFFDEKENDFFVIFTIEELSEKLGFSKTTAVGCCKKLEKLGYINKKRTFNGATKIFIPNIIEKSINKSEDAQENAEMQKNETSKFKKFEYNHTNNNQTNNTNNTINNLKLDELKLSLKTIGGFSEKSVQMLSILTFNDYNYLYKVIGTIYKAKKNTLNEYDNDSGIKLALTIDSKTNDYFDDMHVHIKRILIKAGKINRNMGYIYTSFKNYFKDAVYYYKSSVNDNKYPNIPTMKIIS